MKFSKSFLFSFTAFIFSIFCSYGQALSGQIFYIQQHIVEIMGVTNYTGVLQFMNNATYYSYSTMPKTQEKKDTVDAHGIRYIQPGSAVGERPTGNAVYTDFSTGKLMVAERVGGENFLYLDTLPAIAWELTGEKKIIGDFTCQKAIGAFRGRTYEAWFTPEIPLSYGPWKLGGLPGLILEATTQDGELSFLFESITIPAHEEMIIVPPNKGIRLADFRTFREEADRFIDQSNKRRQTQFENMLKERLGNEASTAKIGSTRTLRFLIEKTLN